MLIFQQISVTLHNYQDARHRISTSSANFSILLRAAPPGARGLCEKQICQKQLATTLPLRFLPSSPTRGGLEGRRPLGLHDDAPPVLRPRAGHRHCELHGVAGADLLYHLPTNVLLEMLCFAHNVFVRKMQTPFLKYTY